MESFKIYRIYRKCRYTIKWKPKAHRGGGFDCGFAMTVILQKNCKPPDLFWWQRNIAQRVEQLAYIQWAGGVRVPLFRSARQESGFAGSLKVFILSFVKVIGNGTMTAVGVILKCHHNGTFPRAGGNMSHYKVSRRFESGRSDWDIIHPTFFIISPFVFADM